MKQNSKSIIIMAIIIFLVVGGFSAISMYNYQKVPMIEITESPFGIQWGTDKEAVENTMAAQGYEWKASDEENANRMVYFLYDYQGVEGADGYAIFTFDESLILTDVLLQFTTADFANGSCSQDMVNMLYKSFRKSLDAKYEKMSYDSLDGYEYWKGENLFTTLFYQESEAVFVLYSQKDAVAERAEELHNSDKAEADATTGDWATAYDTYFDENLMMRDNSQLSTTISQDGLTMNMVVAVSGENFRMLMDMGTSSFDLYLVDGKLYGKSVMDGQEAWTTAAVESEEDAEAAKSMNTVAMENENIVSYSYREEVEIDGVIYDVLDMVVLNNGEEQDMTCYINRETQQIYKYSMMQDGVEYDMFIEDIEGIELPAEAASATEATAKDVVRGMVTVIMAAAMGATETAQ